MATCPCCRSQSCGSCTTVGLFSLCATVHNLVKIAIRGCGEGEGRSYRVVLLSLGYPHVREYMYCSVCDTLTFRVFGPSESCMLCDHR